MKNKYENIVLQKLDIKQKRTAINILQDEKLCEKIANNDIIEIKEFIYNER